MEPVTESHAPEMHGLLSNPDLHTFVPSDPPTLEKLQSQYKFWESRISPKGDELWLNWVGRLPASGELVGHFQAGVNSSLEANLGYTVGIKFQRQGFAHEGLARIIRFLLEDVKIQEVKAWIDTRNSASIGLVKKLGMSEVGFVAKADHFKGSDSDEFIFGLKADSSALKLIAPSIQYEVSFRAAFSELESDSDRFAWIYLGEAHYENYFKTSFAEYVATLLRRETETPPNFVCDSIYWAVLDNEVVGRISIRHELNDFLSKVGGHIGYIVRPSYRGRGIATQMLKQVLRTQRAQQIGKLLLTCDEHNVASEKTIMNAGGTLSDCIDMDPGKPRKKHFWALATAPIL